jgi:glucuronokinase
MNEVAELAEKGKNALLEKNYKELANLMNRNFDLRRQVYTFHCEGIFISHKCPGNLISYA